jgi:hypothetical protein
VTQIRERDMTQESILKTSEAWVVVLALILMIFSRRSSVEAEAEVKKNFICLILIDPFSSFFGGGGDEGGFPGGMFFNMGPGGPKGGKGGFGGGFPGGFGGFPGNVKFSFNGK